MRITFLGQLGRFIMR